MQQKLRPSTNLLNTYLNHNKKICNVNCEAVLWLVEKVVEYWNFCRIGILADFWGRSTTTWTKVHPISTTYPPRVNYYEHKYLSFSHVTLLVHVGIECPQFYIGKYVCVQRPKKYQSGAPLRVWYDISFLINTAQGYLCTYTICLPDLSSQHSAWGCCQCPKLYIPSTTAIKILERLGIQPLSSFVKIL